MIKWVFALCLAFLTLPASAATFQPTVNPLVPTYNSPLASSVIQQNFQHTYSDLISVAGLIGSGGGGGGSGTVTSVSCSATSPAVCSVSNQTTTPAISLTLPQQGNGNFFQMGLGSTTSGDCVNFDANGNVVDAGAGCSTGGSVTWPASGRVVISSGNNTPTGVAEVDGSCLVGSAGGWVAGSCGSGSGVSLANTTSNQTYFLGFTTTTSGSLSTLNGNTSITVNPSTATISATTFAGALTGNASTATSATNATNTALLNSTSNVSYFLNFTTSTSGNLPTYGTPGITVNPSTNTLSTAIVSATTLSATNAALSGTVTAANVVSTSTITGVNAALSGTITTGTLSSTSSIIGVNEALSGTITSANVTSTSLFTGVNAALSGTVTANNLTVTGTCTGCGGGGGGGTGTTGQVAWFSGTNTVTGSSVLFQSTSSYVGIGTTTPANVLDVLGGAYSRVVVAGTQSAAGTLTPDFSAGDSITFTFGAGNLTVANPTHIGAGQHYLMAITQDAVGGRTITWGTDFKWGGGTAPTLSTGAANKDIVSCWADTSTTLECVLAIVNAH